MQVRLGKKPTEWYGNGEIRSHRGTNCLGTAANVHDVTQAAALLNGEEDTVFADAGYRRIDKREEAKDLDVTWHVAMLPGKRRALSPKNRRDQLLEKVEKLKASVRAKVEHPFRVVKQEFGYAKVRCRGLAKNTARLTMLFAMSNLWSKRGLSTALTQPG